MEHDTQRSQTSLKAGAAATRDATAPGRSNRSALLCKCDQAIASGLVKKFTPPKRGVATADADLRSAPNTADSTELEPIATGSVMTIHSEVQSTDPGNPRWFGIEFDRRDGFVAAPLVRIEDPPRREEAPVTNADDELFTGLLERMRSDGEFHQHVKDETVYDLTIDRACLQTFKERGYEGGKLISKALTFRWNVCNLLAVFFIARANDLRRKSRELKGDYPSFKRLVEAWMTAYFVHALQQQEGEETPEVKEDGYVKFYRSLNTEQGCAAGTSPFQKAQGLLKCEGRLIKIWTGGHFYIGRVKDGFLEPYDNNLDKERCRKVNLKEVTEKSTTGAAYDYITKYVYSASPEESNSAAEDHAESAEPAAASPDPAAVSAQAPGADHVQALTPPRLGTATTALRLRSAPTTHSATRMTIDPGSVITLRSEVQTADPSYPQWFGAEVGTRSGFVAAPFVKIEDKPRDTEPAGASEHAAGPDGAHAGSTPSPAPAPGMKTGDPLFSGHLARMRREGEFLQIVPQADKGTLHKATVRAFENKGYTGTTLAQKSRTFRDAACNIMALFFIERAPELRSRTEALKDDYAGYKQQVEDWMTSYFTDALHSGLVKESAWVTSNAALDQSEGCSARDTPYQKAQGLLKCEGRLIRIHVAGHFFIGEVKGKTLYADDNQGDDRKRSGEFDLTEVTPDAKTGKTYHYLKDVLVSASPESAGAAKRGVDEQAGASRAQPASDRAGAPACEC